MVSCADITLARHSVLSHKKRESKKATTVVDTSLTKGLMSNAVAVHVRYNARYVSLPSSAKLQREMKCFERQQLLLIFKIYTVFQILCCASDSDSIWF